MSKPKSAAFSVGWKPIADTWKRGTPPSRPSNDDVSNYKKSVDLLLRKKKMINVLLLGATPEIREMLNKYGSKVKCVVVDINLEMILAMSSIMKNKGEEILVQSDWVFSPLCQNYFDLILGDAVLHNIPRELQNEFLKHQKELLKKDGLFVTRTIVCEEKKYTKTLEEIFSLFLENKANKWAPTELMLTLFFVSTKNGVMSAYKRIKQFVGKNWDKNEQRFNTRHEQINRWLNDPFCLSWMKSKKDFHVNNKRETEKLLNKHFIITNRIISNDFKKHPIYQIVGEGMPFYVLKQKI